jgi:hypothetical protein
MMQLALLLGLAAPTAPPPAREPVIDAFLAALPPGEAKLPTADPSAQGNAEALVKRYPAKVVQIRAAFEDQRRCETTASDAARNQALRESARLLGDERLAKLTSFYRGQDFARLKHLSAAQEAGALSPAEQAQFDRITQDYPLADYLVSSREAQRMMFTDGTLMNALLACETGRDEALAKAGIRP